MDKNNEKKIYLHAFETKVKDGPVRFMVTAAEYSLIESKKNNKSYEVVEVTVEVQDLDNPQGEKEMKTVLIFEDFKSGSFFHQFVTAAVEAAQTTFFTPRMLIGMKGEAKLSHYKPEHADFAYPQMNEWVFYTSSKKVDEALREYMDEEFDVELEELENE